MCHQKEKKRKRKREKDSIDDEERRIGKTINFGVIYGMGAQRFARSTGVSLIEAKYFF